MAQKRPFEQAMIQPKVWVVSDGVISVVVSPKTADFLSISSWTPNENDITTFLRLYLEENSVRYDPVSQMLDFEILRHQKFIGFRLVSPSISEAMQISFKNPPRIVKDGQNLWTKRQYIPSPEDCSRSLGLYQACVLLRLATRPLPFLDPEMTELTLTDMRNENCPNIERIGDFVRLFTGFDHIERALIAYGPAGTGKTELLKAFAQPDLRKVNIFSSSVFAEQINRFGFLIVFKGSGPHFNKKYVGEGEELLRKFEMIAKKNPHLISCLIVDESEDLIADRESESENAEHKKGKVAVLLDMLGGICELKNLVLIAATNLVNSVDGAMHRRAKMSFYGRMSKDQRNSFLGQPHDPILDLTPDFTISQMIRYTKSGQLSLAGLRSFLRSIHMEPGLEFCRELIDNLSPDHMEPDHVNIFQHDHPLWTCLSETPGVWTFRPAWGTLSPLRLDVPLTVNLNLPNGSYLYKYLLEHSPVQHFTAINRETVYRTMRKRPTNLEEAIDTELRNRLDEYEFHYDSSLVVINVEDLIGLSVENNISDSKTVNQSVNPDVDNNGVILESLAPLSNFYGKINEEDRGANVGKGLWERVQGTNRSASVASQVYSSEQTIAQHNANLLQQLLLGQYQSGSGRTIKPLRPLILSTLTNEIMNRARKDHLIIVLQFNRPAFYDYFVSIFV